MSLNSYGFQYWSKAVSLDPNLEDAGIARVTAVDRGACMVHDGAKEHAAEASGRLLFQVDDPLDLPCVGDWVRIRRCGDGPAVIEEVLPRQGLLRRRRPGGGGAQAIAANLDTAFLVQACGPDFNPSRLERSLVLVAEAGAAPVVLLTKTDLVSPDEAAALLNSMVLNVAAPVLAVSNVTGEGLDALRHHLLPGKTCCLLGSSGVGKTSLINGLTGTTVLRTGEVSGTGEGTHTTTRRQLLLLEGGGLLIDTPGMRELGMTDAHGSVHNAFEDIAQLALGCRYADCTHCGEPGCAVQEAVRDGALALRRYENYRKLTLEANHYAMSALERRHKDKAFGRHLKLSKRLLGI